MTAIRKPLSAAILFTVSILLSALTSLAVAQDDDPNFPSERMWPGIEAALPYVIERLDVEIEVFENDTMSVVETISVRYNQSRRGIIRNIPVRYQTDKGTTRTMAIKVGKVVDGNGKPVTTKVSGITEKNIRLGDENIHLPPGTRVTYVIPYTVRNMTNWHDATSDWERNAEIYWNAIGTQWDTTIAKSKVTVKFPQGADASELRAILFWGRHGATDSLQVIGEGEDAKGRISMRLSTDELVIVNDRGLLPRMGMTFALSLPERLIPEPPLWWRAFVLAISQPGLWMLLITFGALYPLWHKYGRDPKVERLEVAFEPPDGLGAGEAGAFSNESVNTRDIAAMLVSLAVKGYLRFHPKEEGWVRKTTTYDVEVLPPPRRPKPLTETEAQMLRHLKGKRKSTIKSEDLKTLLGSKYYTYHSGLYSSLVDLGYYQKCPNTVRTTTIGTGMVALFILGFILAPFAQDELKILLLVVGGIVSFVLVIFFGAIMPARTQHGAKKHAKLVGFENYLKGRGDYLTWVGKTKPAEVEFEEYLPYAFALGHVEEWSKSFEGLIKEPPSWYAGTSMSTFTYSAFCRDLTSMSTSLQSAASPPSSSASGGSGFSGGSSGGGGGGGGGSSW